MKKQLFITTVLLLILGTVSYAAMPTEKDIGPCTARNSKGFCSQSKTHYCAQFGSNGRCVVWYSKSKSTYENAVNQINSFDEAINKAIEKQEKEQKLNQGNINQEELKFQKEFPIVKKIENSILEYEKENNELQRKKDLGLPYDETRYQILSYRISELHELQRGPGSDSYSMINGESMLTTEGIHYEYAILLQKLNNKEITQEEFNYLKAKLILAAGELENIYNITLKSNGIVNFTQKNSDDAEYSNDIKNKDIKPSKIETFNNGLNNGVNILNNTMNNVRVIKGLFGY